MCMGIPGRNQAYDYLKGGCMTRWKDMLRSQIHILILQRKPS